VRDAATTVGGLRGTGDRELHLVPVPVRLWAREDRPEFERSQAADPLEAVAYLLLFERELRGIRDVLEPTPATAPEVRARRLDPVGGWHQWMGSGGPAAGPGSARHRVPELRERLAEHHVRRVWSTLVGADVARRAKPQGLVEGCLTVIVDNSPWLHKLTLRADELTARLCARFPAVRALRFTLGTLEEAGPS